MKDGLYQVTYRNICAGFVIKNGEIIDCAPILKKNFWFLVKFAKKVERKND